MTTIQERQPPGVRVGICSGTTSSTLLIRRGNWTALVNQSSLYGQSKECEQRTADLIKCERAEATPGDER